MMSVAGDVLSYEWRASPGFNPWAELSSIFAGQIFSAVPASKDKTGHRARPSWLQVYKSGRRSGSKIAAEPAVWSSHHELVMA